MACSVATRLGAMDGRGEDNEPHQMFRRCNREPQKTFVVDNVPNLGGVSPYTSDYQIGVLTNGEPNMFAQDIPTYAIGGRGDNIQLLKCAHM